jgi:hypothetical protein
MPEDLSPMRQRAVQWFASAAARLLVADGVVMSAVLQNYQRWSGKFAALGKPGGAH